ncbi:MAG: endonuclease/exonuclease/phosphatase family protein [Paludibacteraceae bacterium]|nr:endonuclease/exonuclease/phosphatase family protein [Paludibacteraceae bacterium]
MRLNNFLTAIFLLFIFLGSSCIQKKTTQDGTGFDVTVNAIAFYNLENLFDTIDNENVNDAEFLPNGANKWGTMKYNSKLQRMAYAISQIAIDQTPVGAAILGVSEIENRLVLEDLVKQPEIKNRSYQIVHYDGPDRRGVDVGLLYNPRYFTVTNSKSYRLYTDDPEFLTRDQLMVSGYLQDEKIHIIVNHWPSRYGGEMRSRPKRNAAAALTRSIVDSLHKTEPKARIIVMGDLNDDPTNESCATILGAKKELSEVNPGDLYNVLWKTFDTGIGSLSYNNQWNLFDQIILSHQLSKGGKGNLRLWKSEVFYRNFLIQQEGRYKGTPLRTHAGGVWLNGYSDHLPTIVYLIKETK